MPKFSNSSSANLTPIYIQPTAPQVPPTLNADDLKQVTIVNKMKKKIESLTFFFFYIL